MSYLHLITISPFNNYLEKLPQIIHKNVVRTLLGHLTYSNQNNQTEPMK